MSASSSLFWQPFATETACDLQVIFRLADELRRAVARRLLPANHAEAAILVAAFRAARTGRLADLDPVTVAKMAMRRLTVGTLH